MGWYIFVNQIGTSFYTSGNSFILGMISTPQVVGYYAAAERIYKAVLGLIWPIHQALYPWVSNLAKGSMVEAAMVARRSLYFFVSLASLATILLLLAAPALIQVLLGPSFLAAIPVLQVLGLMLPFVEIGMVLGLHWLLPLGLDRHYTGIILGGGMLNLGLALLLVPAYAQIGMAGALLITEAAIAGAFFLLLWRLGRNPFTTSPTEPSSNPAKTAVH